VKFDFLGLATLTILELAREFIRARRPGMADFSYEALPLDDARTYQLFGLGQTEAVFQFESRGMQGMLRDAKPSRLEDLIALNAMYRPGPMDNIPSFCARKHGKEPITYPHPLLATVLEETYGIFVYQEQVMQAAQVLGGYSLGGADLLRRAMGKKKPEEMAKQRQIFREGAARQGITQAQADEVFDLMEKFAGYGFNKSHAAAYALLAYHTGWLKVHCTAEFFAANMTVESDDTDKLRVLLADAQLMGIGFEPPDINRGGVRFEPVSDRLVRYGLAAVKGTGAGAIEAIVAAREAGGPFRSLFDFAARVDRHKVNKRAVEALVKAGAFDALESSRAALVAAVPLAWDWAETQEANAHQGGLFDFDEPGGAAHGSSMQEPPLPIVVPWDVRERLLQEKTALGFFLSGHLFDVWRDEVRRFARRSIAELAAAAAQPRGGERGGDRGGEGREPVLVAGVVSALRVVNGQRGRLALFQVDDGSEPVEATADEALLDANKALLAEDQLVVLQGRLQPDRFSGGVRLNVHRIWDLAAARARFGRWLAVELGGDTGAHAAGLGPGAASPTLVPPLADLVTLWPPRPAPVSADDAFDDTPRPPLGLPVRLRVHRAGAVADIDLGEDGRFWPCDEALGRWRSLARGGAALVVYE
jgi:DNA polymerase-3 subunit alpha